MYKDTMTLAGPTGFTNIYYLVQIPWLHILSFPVANVVPETGSLYFFLLLSFTFTFHSFELSLAGSFKLLLASGTHL